MYVFCMTITAGPLPNEEYRHWYLKILYINLKSQAVYYALAATGTGIGESLLTSLFTFLLISIRLT